MNDIVAILVGVASTCSKYEIGKYANKHGYKCAIVAVVDVIGSTR